MIIIDVGQRTPVCGDHAFGAIWVQVCMVITKVLDWVLEGWVLEQNRAFDLVCASNSMHLSKEMGRHAWPYAWTMVW